MAEYRPIANPVEASRQRILGIEQRDAEMQRNGMDMQESAERLEAAQAYFGEDETHFVNYVREMVRSSAQAERDIRDIQQECWQVYQEDPPPNYKYKNSWQSRVIVPKPHGAVQFAMAAVKQAFTPNFLTIEDKRNEALAAFWRKVMDIQLDREHGKFVSRFTMGSGMAFAVGQSFEFIPIWRPGHGLDFSLVEPWKIHRDPDALPLEPQSGMYWIHEEFQDLWVLNEQEKQGRYVNTFHIGADANEEQNPENYQMDRARTAELRQQTWQRNTYRKSVLTREYWGAVLDKRGHLIHPSLVFTTAGNRVIGMPEPTQYPILRWPGVSFSPLPNFLRFNGRSLLQSIRSLWHFMCNLYSLHVDYLNWIVNPMVEITQQQLIDQDDYEQFPGKTYLVRNTIGGQPAVRTVDRRFATNEVLANKMAADQDFQRGTFITDPIQGLPGYRQQVTARESAQNLQQSMTVFSIMGEHLDHGAIEIIRAAMETIQINITRPDLLNMFDMEQLFEVFGDSPFLPGQPGCFVPTLEEAVQLGLPIDANQTSWTGVRLPGLTGTFHVSGLQSILKDFQVMQAIQNILLPLSENPRFQPYIKPYNLLRAIEVRSGLQDEGLVADMKEAAEIDQQTQRQQKELMDMQTQAFQQQQELIHQKAEAEAKKADMLAARLDLDARKAEVEIRQQAIAAEREHLMGLGELAIKEAELDQEEAQAVKMAAEIVEMRANMERELIEAEANLRKIEAQIEQGDRKLELEHQKMLLDARLQERQIALQEQTIRMQAARERNKGSSNGD